LGKRISQLKLRIIGEIWEALSFFSGLSVICGFIVIGFQVLFWLKDGEWFGVSLLGIFYLAKGFSLILEKMDSLPVDG